jgi:glyoxylase-like metal-dependent hydrolase (beta-lactamase superfamily II)
MSRIRNLFLAALFVCLASPFASRPATAQTFYLPGGEPPIPPKDSTLTIRVQQLAPGVYAAKLSFVWTGWVELPDGILVIDSGMADSAGTALADTIRARSPNRPFRYLVLTHAQEDHILGARAFLAAGATLVTQAGVSSQIDSILGITPNPAKEIRVDRRKRFGGAARPVDVVWVGQPANSAADLVVHLPKQRILFAGDLVSYRSIPWLLDRGFSMTGWLATLDSLSTKRFAADQLVPGHGLIAKPLEAIHFTRSYLGDADEKASKVAGWGTTPIEVRRWGYLGAYEGMEFYDEVHFLNMRRLYAEAKGMKTPGRGRMRVYRK